MPAKIIKNSDGTYDVRTPNGLHASHITLPKAQGQQRLLDAIDHGWRPGKGKRKRGKTMMG